MNDGFQKERWFRRSEMKTGGVFVRKMFFINLIMALCIIAIFSLNTGSPSGTPAKTAKTSICYVSPDGSDSNPGTEEEPWETIQRAAESVGPGSTVYIKAGTYFERIDISVSGNETDGPITFTNYNEDLVIIDGSKSTAEDQEDLIRISDQSFIKVNGLELANNINKDKAFLATGIGIWGKGQGIEITNCRIHDIGYIGTSAKIGAHAIAVYGRDEETPISDLIIEGNEIWDIQCGGRAAVAISGNVDEFRITGNRIHDTDNTGLMLVGDGTIDSEPVCAAEALNRARNGIVTNNEITGNTNADNPVYQKKDYSAAGIEVNGARDITIAYNQCSENDMGIKIGNEKKDKLSSGIVLRENLIYSNNSCGIQVGGDTAASGWAADCEIRNNTLYNNDTQKLGFGEIHIAKSHDLTLSSNLVSAGAQNLAVTTRPLGVKYIYRITMNHNLYYGPGGSRGLRFTGIDTGSVGLRMWVSKTQQDKNSKIADPKFVDASKADFHLKQWSPAIDFGDAALVAGTDETDFDENARINGKGVDCGAFEF